MKLNLLTSTEIIHNYVFEGLKFNLKDVFWNFRSNQMDSLKKYSIKTAFIEKYIIHKQISLTVRIWIDETHACNTGTTQWF